MENNLLRQSAQPLIRTKLFAPPLRTRLVSRPRLVSRLRQAAEYPLTLVCAPAGYGKTMLLAAWLAEGAPDDIADTRIKRDWVGWLSLDTEDNDAYRFLAYLLAVLQKTQPGIGGDAQALLQSPQTLPPKAVLAAMINDLQELAHPLWLVLDDYQFIENLAIHEGIAFLLEHLPAAFHLLIATRADPPSPLHRLRARNQLLELRADDLRFTTDEAAAFLNQGLGLSLSPVEIVTLESRTEGWIAGLQMAALSMQGLADHSTFVRDFGGSHRYILEYLIEEILNRQPGDIQAFLLQTSILDRLCPSLCAAVLEEPQDIREYLDTLERSNLFLTSLDEIRCWYRYHHLFADLLRARLVQSQPELLPVLHSRASVWFEREGLPEEAIKHALAANASERAAQLVERYTMEILNRGEMSALLHFIEALPEDLVIQSPGLCIQHAWALTFSGQLGQAAARLKQAEAQVQPGDNSPQAREILGSAAIIRGLIAEISGDLPTAVSLARTADALIPADNYQARSVIPYVLGDGYYAAGDLEQAEQAYQQILQIGRVSGNVWTSEVALLKLSLVKKLQGKLHAIWELHQEALRLAEEKNNSRSGSMGATYVGISNVQYEWNALEDARETAVQAIQSMEHWPSPTDRVSAYISLSRTAIAQDDLPAAEEALSRAAEIASQGKIFPATQASLESCQVRLLQAKEEWTALRQWAQERGDSIDFRPHGKPDYVAERQGLNLARALIAVGDGCVDRAILLLNALAEASRAAGYTGLLIEVLALLAHACRIQGDGAAASNAIHECLALAKDEGFLRVFLDEGEQMRALLEDIQSKLTNSAAAADLPLQPYLAQILSAFPPSQPDISNQDRGEPEPQPAKTLLVEPEVRSAQNMLIEPLSQRELEVLALICQGATNQEIAGTLVVTLNTVKKHNSRIFGKLGVTSRVQAVLLARRLGLVPESTSPPDE